MTEPTLQACLARYPGAVVEVASDGVVRVSNGRLEELVGRDVQGVAFEELLDASSVSKWHKLMSMDERDASPRVWEFIVETPASLELRPYLCIWCGSGEAEVLWLLEQSLDPKRDALYEELAELHRELVAAQRALGRERDRLAGALEEARTAVRLRDEVLGIVSHDLRGPLHSMSLAAQLLEGDLSGDRRRHHGQLIRHEVRRMGRLISDLLDVSAIGAGHLSIEPVRIDPVGLLRGVRAAHRARAEEQRVRLRLDIRHELPPLVGDPDRLSQVLDNLIGNAVRLAPDRGTVTIEADVDGDHHVVISVVDDGPGIPRSHQDGIFDRFWHGSREQRGGTGLGLAIAKGIVEAHGGRIWVESTPGEGASFRFALPVADE